MTMILTESARIHGIMRIFLTAGIAARMNRRNLQLPTATRRLRPALRSLSARTRTSSISPLTKSRSFPTARLSAILIFPATILLRSEWIDIIAEKRLFLRTAGSRLSEMTRSARIRREKFILFLIIAEIM